MQEKSFKKCFNKLSFNQVEIKTFLMNFKMMIEQFSIFIIE